MINYAKVEIYKILEQWEKENPGVAETLSPSLESDEIVGANRRNYLNQRFVYEFKRIKI